MRATPPPPGLHPLGVDCVCIPTDHVVGGREQDARIEWGGGRGSSVHQGNIAVAYAVFMAFVAMLTTLTFLSRMS